MDFFSDLKDTYMSGESDLSIGDLSIDLFGDNSYTDTLSSIFDFGESGLKAGAKSAKEEEEAKAKAEREAETRRLNERSQLTMPTMTEVKSSFDKFIENPLYLFGGGVALVLVIVAVVRGR